MRRKGATDPLTAFLAHAALEAGETQEAEGRPALQLMTIHSAKGLEFHTVFVTGLEEGLFPHENSMNEFDGVEEERRLMYVAVTRARRKLYVTHAQSRMLHGQMRYNIPIRFVDEIPRELMLWLSPQRQRARAFDVDEAEWGKRARSAPQAHAAGPDAGGSGRACGTPSSGSASSSTPRAVATTRACRSIFATPASSGWHSNTRSWKRHRRGRRRGRCGCDSTCGQRCSATRAAASRQALTRAPVSTT